MKNNWQIKKLWEVCDDLFAGGDVPKNNSSKFKTNIFNVPIFSNGEKNKGLYGYTDIARVTKSSITISARGTIGYSEIREEDFYPAIRLIVVIPKTDIVDLFFLKYVISTINFIKSGSSIPQLTVPMIKEYPISLPPLSEQKRIVKVLDEVFGKLEIAKNNAEKNLQNSKALFESYLQSVFVNSTEQYKLGDKNLIQIIDGDRGKNYPNKSDFLQEGYCLFLNTKNVRPNGFDFKTTMFVTQKKDAQLGNGKLQRNDVLLTTRGTIGNIAVYDENVPFENIRINSGMLIFRPNMKLIIPEYLFAIFQSGIMKSQIKKYVSGAAQPQLPIKTLVNFLIPVPKSITEQKTIVKKLDELSEQTKKLEVIYKKKLADLEELKKSVLKKVFSGQL